MFFIFNPYRENNQIKIEIVLNSNNDILVEIVNYPKNYEYN